MYYFRILLLLLFTFLALSTKLNHETRPGSSGKVSYTAYYFHPTPRCQSCLNLESFTKELIKTKFSRTPLVFKSINIDEDENEHYKNDFGLVFSSLILVKYKNGAQVKWINLESVWSYTGDKEQFFSYAEKEIKNFIKE